MNPSYENILHFSRPRSWHRKMPRQDRAKLFAPFAALNGFEDSIQDRDRLLSPRICFSEDTWTGWNRTLRSLQRGDYVTVTYFLPVKLTAEGDLGEYRTVSSLFLKIDEIKGRLLMDGATIPLADIAGITGEDADHREADDAGLQ